MTTTTTPDTAPVTGAGPAPPPPPDGRTTLRALVAPVRGRLVTGCVLAGVGAGLRVVPAIAVAELARVLLTPPAAAAQVWTWTAVGAVATVAASLAASAASHLCHLADADFRHRTRRRVVRHLATLPLGWFTTRGSGEVKQAVGDDVKAVHPLVAHTLADAVATVAGPVVAGAYLVRVDWLFTLLLLGFLGGTLAVAVPRLNAAYRTHMRAWERAEGRIAAEAVELVDGIEVVKAFGTGGGVFGRFTTALTERSRVSLRWMRAIGGPNLALTNLFSAAGLMTWTVLAGIVLIALGRADVADLVAFLAVGVGIPAGLMNLVQLGYVTREAQAAATHLREVLDTPRLPEPAAPGVPADGGVELDRVGFAYDDGTVALTGVSARFEPGTVTAVVGASGSGKTTLARLVPRFWDVTEGRVLVGGVDVRDVPAATLLGRVAFVFQETVLLHDTVAANLRLGDPAATDAQVRAAAAAARVHDRVAALPHGYDTVLGEDGAGLSGGERQRLAIARALLQDAPVVILDEATAHADPESETEVQRALSTLAAGRTVVVIAHRLHTIRDADQILVLDRGRLVERGRHEDLLAAGGPYARLWRTQNPDGRTAVTDEG